MRAAGTRRWVACSMMSGAVLVVAAACVNDAGQGGAVASAHEPEERSRVHVDSIFPIDEEIRRFKAQLTDSVAGLTGGATSAEALIARFMSALEIRDTTTLAQLTVTPAEFIYLYYPNSRFTTKPWDMSPQLVWFQLGNYGNKGLNRALDRFGGRPLAYVDHACDAQIVEGPNRILAGCVIRVSEPGDVTNHGASGASVAPHSIRSLSLFGQILERDGVWKFINYGNSL